MVERLSPSRGVQVVVAQQLPQHLNGGPEGSHPTVEEAEVEKHLSQRSDSPTMVISFARPTNSMQVFFHFFSQAAAEDKRHRQQASSRTVASSSPLPRPSLRAAS